MASSVDTKPVAPLTQSQTSDLLREEIILQEKALRFRHVPKAPGELEPPRDVLNIRLTYSISTPFPSLSADVLRTRKEVKAAAGSAAGGEGDASTAGAAGSSSAGEAKVGSLGSFTQCLLFDGPACLRELLKAGCKPDSYDLVQSTPLHKATANGDARAIQLLLGAGGNIDAPNMYGDTSMHRAVENSRLETLVMLLRSGADLDRPNKIGNTPLHLAASIGHVPLVRALLSAGALPMAYNMRGYAPLHVAIMSGKKQALIELISFHEKRRIDCFTLCTQASNDNPIHVAVRALRIPLLIWMVEHSSFGPGLVMKNIENRDPMKLLKEAGKLLKKMMTYRKKVLKAQKVGKDPPAKPNAIIPPPPPPVDPRPLHERIADQKAGTTQAYLMESPCYVKFNQVPAPPPEPKGKKKKGGGKKGKKEKVVPPPPFTCTLDQALETDRTEGKGPPYISEQIKNLAKKYDEEKKAAEKLAQEKAKLKAAAEKDAKAKAEKEKAAKGKKGK